MTRPRIAIIFLIGMCVLYFFVGGLAIGFGRWDWKTYLEIGGIVGCLASVMGLASLLRAGLSNTDLQQYDVEVMKRFAAATEEFQKVDRSRTETQQQLDELKRQHEQMKALAQKAALSVFLTERRRRCAQEIRDAIARDSELSRLLAELPQIDNRLRALGEEIDQSPDLEMVHDIITGAARGTYLERLVQFLVSTKI